MNFMLIQNAPVAYEDINNIQLMLKNSDVLIGARVQQAALYNAVDYLIFNNALSGEVKVLLDRNFLTKIVNIAKGKEINSSDPLYKLASAAMFFFIYCEVLIEPGLALYEYAHGSSHSQALDDLILFRIADHIHPQVFADIALSRSVLVDKKELDIAKQYAGTISETREDDYAKQISHWELNYLFALKITQLKKMSLPPEQKVEKFISWMHEEALYSAVASIFAALFLCPSPPEKKMIKGIDSNNAEKLHHGIKNAAWDMAYLTYWGQCLREADKKTTWLLCSNDKALKRIAKALYVSTDIDEESAITSLLNDQWGTTKSTHLTDIIMSYTNSAKNDGNKRDALLQNRFPLFPKMTHELEVELMLPLLTIPSE